MKDKLLKIARYLGQNGFYKEAAELKKLATSGLNAESPYGPGYDPNYHPYDAAPALPKGPSGGRNPDDQRFYPGDPAFPNYFRGWEAERRRGGAPENYAEDDNETVHKYIVEYEDGVSVNKVQKEIKEAARRKGFTVTFTEPDDDQKIDLDTEDEAKKYDLVTVSHPENLITDETNTMTFIEELDSVLNVIAVD